MEITNEIKSKVFAQYLGQEIYGDLQTSEEPDYGTIDLTIDEFDFAVNEGMKLLLTPISKIGDEDAIEVAKLSPQFQYTSQTEFEVWINDFGNKVVSSGKGIFADNKWVIDLKHGIKKLNYMQYGLLQSRGYDLPQYLLGGKTLIEAGLAIDKTQLQ